MSEPIGFPPLAKAVLPGDKVVLALAPDVPQATTIVARIVEVLVSGGVANRDITLLVARREGEESSGARQTGSASETDLGWPIPPELHRADHRESLGYLAASWEARPIYVNRKLHDADLVIPIGCAYPEHAPGYYGVSSAIFPTFLDGKTIALCRAARLDRAADRRRVQQQADQVRWLLGVRFVIQVVPGSGSDVVDVLAGDVDSVQQIATNVYRDCWSFDVPARADLVVATITGDEHQQSWENFGRALWAARHVVNDAGAVAVCSDLAEQPGPALRQIPVADDRARLPSVARMKSPDALAAMELARALERGSVYLCSQLPENLVEELGMSAVAPEHVSRLAARYDSVIVLANAHRAVASADDEPAIAEHWAKERSRG